MKISILAFLLLAVLILESTVSDNKTEKSIKKFLDKNFAFVPSGNAFMDEKEISVQSFYISKTEIANKEFRVFLNDLKVKGELEKWKISQIDSSNWKTKSWSNQAYVEHYHSHLAYENYPVVNINHEAANLYCQWLSEKYDSQFASKGKFKFRLMKRAEYIRSARGDSKNSYAWNTNSLRNSDGQILCNFTQLGSEDISQNTENGTYEVVIAQRDHFPNQSDVLAPSKSYWPNQFGIYNLNGNAAEMIDKFGISVGGSWKNTGYDVRVDSKSVYDQANPYTGFRVVMTSVQSAE